MSRRLSARARTGALTVLLFTSLLTIVVRGQGPDRQANATPLSLEQAIAQALDASPSLKAARLQRPVDVAGVGVARERPNPDLTYDANKETPRQAITATIPIELGGKRARRIDLAQATVASGDATLAQTIFDLRNDVRRAYFDAVAAATRVTMADEVHALVVRARDAADARYAAGEVPHQELLQAQLALLEADSDVTAARGEADATRAELNVLMGQPADARIVLTDTLSNGVLPTLDAAIAAASSASTEVAATDRRIDEQTARRNLARALQVPDVSAGGAVTYDAMPDFQVGWRLTGTITLPIVTRHRAGVESEDAELTRLRAEREALVARIAGAVAAARLRAAAARDQLDRYERDAAPAIAQIEAMAQDGYRLGETNLVALLTALQQTRSSRDRGVQAGIDFQHALADLERAIGAPVR